MRRMKLRGARGQALTETVLLTTLLLFGGLGTMVLLHSNPEFLDAIGIYVRGFYYMLALPIP